MKRSFSIASAGLTLLAFGLLPTVASAQHHGRRHHRRGAHAHLESFGTNNPAAPASKDAGTVTSFAGGMLVVKLNDGTSVTGEVTSATQLECEAAEPAIMARTADHGGRGDQGSGGNEESDRHGGPETGDEQSQSEDGSSGAPTSNPTSATTPGEDDANDADDGPGPVAGQPTTGGENDEGQGCDMTALTAGVVVRDAELRVTSAGAIFVEVKIIR
jgi:hypothetical protein